MDILILTGLTLPEVSEVQLERITEAAGPGARVTVTGSMPDALEAAKEAEVILGYLTPRLFAAAPRLRWVHAIASGIDAYLFSEFRDSDVVLTGEKGLVGGHLADHAFALLLALTRRLAQAVRLGPDAWQRRGQMRRAELELEGLVMGIVGFGGTGRAIARRAGAFGMSCRAVDRESVEPSPEVVEVRSLDFLPELLAGSDVVALGCPLTPETRDLIDDAAFAQMKPSAFLINVTRGEIVDADALLRALREGRIAGAGLDVVAGEPLPPDHPLFELENVVMTPHTAGASQHRAERNVARFCENLERLRRGEPLAGVVDKEAGF